MHGWQNLISSDLKPDPDYDTFDIWVFLVPPNQDPWVLATYVALMPESMFALYLDHWPVGQVPLSAKQMIGLHRHFDFAPESCLRLPELALLVRNYTPFISPINKMIRGSKIDHSKELCRSCNTATITPRTLKKLQALDDSRIAAESAQ